jgi:HAMP domain-containing protein
LSVLARLPLRSKLIAVVSVPLFVILVFSGFGISGRLDDLDGQRQYSRLRAPNDALATLQTSIEDEGVLTTWYAAAKRDPVVGAKLSRARHVTDRSITDVRTAGEELGDDVSNPTRRAWERLERDLHSLSTLRQQVDESAGLPATFGDQYGDLDDEVLDVAERLARDIGDRQLSVSMVGIVDLRREQAASARDAMIVLPYLATGSSTQFNAWIASLTAQDAAAAKFLASATPAERAAFQKLRAESSPESAFRLSAGSVPTAFPAASITPGEYYENWRKKQAYLVEAIGAVQRVVDDTAATLESEALRDVLWYGFGVAFLVLVVLALAWVMIRSVNRSLRSLTEAARDVADVQLPQMVETLQRGGDPGGAHEIQPIAVSSNDEIGELARAFNTIQETTVRVAEQQAGLLRKGIGDLYVNLARRNQSLLDRQISLLDMLESRAEDPDQLGSLFELDHLATRMRRNAESLLVLSGAGQARQWSEAIPILDVVRAASAEIADFARVTFVGFEGDVAIAGNAVADVTHILAELLENATSFSPPGTAVVVAGMLTERRFVVSITDEGIGMDEDRLAVANRLLQSPPPPGLSLSRTLGLHVVAHLARRYNIRVQLRRAAVGGVSAIVALPAAVLARLSEPEPAPAPAPTLTHTPSPLVDLPSFTWDPAVAPPPDGPPIDVPGDPFTADLGSWDPVEIVEPLGADPAGITDPVVDDGGLFDEVGTEPIVEIVDAAAVSPEVPFEAIVESPESGEPASSLYDFDADATANETTWFEPEIVPPAFDPDAPAPTAATPADPLPYRGPTIDSLPLEGGPDLPRRTPGASPLGGDSGGALPTRSPGRHLSHHPAQPPEPGGERDARPRPERVHDLLTRHLRGIRDGRGDDLVAQVASDAVDSEETP